MYRYKKKWIRTYTVKDWAGRAWRNTGLVGDDGTLGWSATTEQSKHWAGIGGRIRTLVRRLRLGVRGRVGRVVDRRWGLASAEE